MAQEEKLCKNFRNLFFNDELFDTKVELDQYFWMVTFLLNKITE